MSRPAPTRGPFLFTLTVLVSLFIRTSKTGGQMQPA